MFINGKEHFTISNPHTYAFVGAKGEGKTSTSRKIYNDFEGNAVYYSFRPDEPDEKTGEIYNGTLIKSLSEIKKRGKYKTDLRYVNKKDFFDFIIDLRNTLVIIDDSFALVRWNLPMNLAAFLINNRGYKCPTILVLHGFYYVPDEMFLYVKYVIAWKTYEAINKDIKSLPSGRKIVSAYNHLATSKQHTKVFIEL